MQRPEDHGWLWGADRRSISIQSACQRHLHQWREQVEKATARAALDDFVAHASRNFDFGRFGLRVVSAEAGRWKLKRAGAKAQSDAVFFRWRGQPDPRTYRQRMNRRLAHELNPRRQRLVAQAAPDAQGLHGFRHVVDAQDLGALLHRLEREGDAAAEALVGGRFVRQRADACACGWRRRRAGSRANGTARGRSSARGCAPTFLPKPKPGSIEDLVARDAGLHRRRDPLLQPHIHFDQHVVVARVVLHHFGRALVMHQDDRHLRRGDDARRARRRRSAPTRR